jgi:hypothetical protein
MSENSNYITAPAHSFAGLPVCTQLNDLAADKTRNLSLPLFAPSWAAAQFPSLWALMWVVSFPSYAPTVAVLPFV